MITLILPWPVSANRYWATRVIQNKTTGKWMAMTYVTAEAKQFKEEVGWLAKSAGVRAPMPGRIAIEYTLFPHRPQDWARRMRKDPVGWEDTVMCIDLDNAQKVLLDSLKGICFDDDKWVRSIVARRGEPRERAGMEVRISQIAVDQPQTSLELV